MRAGVDLTYEILSWAELGGRHQERPATLNGFDHAAIHRAIGVLVEDRGWIAATRSDSTDAGGVPTYFDLHLTPTGKAQYARLRRKR